MAKSSPKKLLSIAALVLGMSHAARNPTSQIRDAPAMGEQFIQIGDVLPDSGQDRSIGQPHKAHPQATLIQTDKRSDTPACTLCANACGSEWGLEQGQFPTPSPHQYKGRGKYCTGDYSLKSETDSILLCCLGPMPPLPQYSCLKTVTFLPDPRYEHCADVLPKAKCFAISFMRAPDMGGAPECTSMEIQALADAVEHDLQQMIEFGADTEHIPSEFLRQNFDQWARDYLVPEEYQKLAIDKLNELAAVWKLKLPYSD